MVFFKNTNVFEAALAPALRDAAVAELVPEFNEFLVTGVAHADFVEEASLGDVELARGCVVVLYL